MIFTQNEIPFYFLYVTKESGVMCDFLLLIVMEYNIV